jgi:hypothetical protein
MREIKVQCDCGQKYQFEVDPVDGQMPYAVICPVCGLDGTKKANSLLSSPPPPVPAMIAPVAVIAAGVSDAGPAAVATLAPPSPPSARVRVMPPLPNVAASNVPAAPTSEPVPPAAPADRPRLRISSAAHAAPPESVATSTPTLTPPPPPPRRMAGISRVTSSATAESSGRKPSFALGLLGALLGAVIGSVIYFGILGYTGFHLGLMGIGVGFLAGLGARWLGKEGSNELGVITATLTLVGILGAQYFVAWKWWNEDSFLQEETAASDFKEMQEEATRVVKVIPTGSDQEIRIFLAREEVVGTGEAPNFAEVTAEEIKEFRETELPEMRELASGKMTLETWQQKLKDEAAAEEAAKTEEEREEEDRTFKFFFMLLLLNKVNLISMVAGAGLAYKMSTDAPG